MNLKLIIFSIIIGYIGSNLNENLMKYATESQKFGFVLILLSVAGLGANVGIEHEKKQHEVIR